jgi:hypothetical protein
MAIDFPASPTNGQTFTSGALVYTYDGTKWTAQPAGVTGGTKIEVSNTKAEIIDTGTDGRFVVTTEGSERLRVTSAGLMGLGTASPDALCDISSNTRNVLTDVNSASNYNLYLKNPDNANGEAVGLCFGLSNGGGIGASIYHLRSGANSFGSLIFATKPNGGSNQERARIDSLGRLLVGTSSSTDAKLVVANGSEQQVSFKIDNTNTSPIGFQIRYGTDVNGTANRFIDCIGNATTRFLVFSNGNVQNTNNSYAGISDLKLKENIVESSSQWDDLKALQVKNFNFIGDNNKQIGLVAQQVEQICPGLVEESPDLDETGADLGTVTKSVKYSVLYMKAVKALQEAIGRIETLEAKVAALESQQPQ